MNKQQKKQQFQLDNRQNKKAEMVAQTHKKNIKQGVFESITDIFSRLPVSRIAKSGYKFIFQNVKQNVEMVLEHENKAQDLQKQQQQAIDAIDVKFTQPVSFPPDEELFKQKLYSDNALFRSLIFLRNQDKIFGFAKHEGQMQPFLLDSHYIQLEKIKKQIPNIKLFMQGGQPMKRHSFQFISQNQLIFKDKSFPSTYEFDRRAEILAKIYLLDLYREQSRRLLVMDKNDEAQLQKKRLINKIKQQNQIQKMKQGQLIQDVDLQKQVFKILEWIQRKMNALAYEQFKNKNGDRATQIKKSLQKLKNHVHNQSNAMNKLKILITYKYKKGF